jgi:regulator of sigma E protease
MSIILFLVVLVVLILVHELGHFAVAKLFGIRVDEFGLGFPPKVFGKRYGETEYTLNALPIGGFVRIWGEDPTDENIHGTDSDRSFVNKPKYAQAAVLVAGVAMNVILAWVLFTAGFLFGMPSALSEEDVLAGSEARLLVTSVLPDSPAAEVLKPSDEIVRIVAPSVALENAERPLLPSEVSDLVSTQGGNELTISVMRRDGVKDIVVGCCDWPV